MQEDIRMYARLGLVHHLLYPGCTSDPDYHLSTLEELVERDDIETVDCCLPYGQERRQRLIQAIRRCGKEVYYSIFLFPLSKISLASTDPSEQGLARVVLADQIDVATAIGARGIVFASGADVPEIDRPRAREAFAELCRWLCDRVRPYGMLALLEPFDQTVDKRFLYGPTADCAALVRSLRPALGNLAIELDMAHLPLMGESFSKAIRTVAPFLARVHLGNCVLKDRSSPLYGDQHPPLGIAGGEIDVPQLAEILALLLEAGYLRKERRGALVLEIKPLTRSTAEETVADNMARLRQAWSMV